MLGITIENELKFDQHISNVCMKAQRKLTVLTRTRKYLNFSMLKIRFKTICQSQFKFCSLKWMSYSRNTNNKINKLHEKALRLAYNDCASTFEELLEKDKSFTLLHYNIQTICKELYKVYNNLSQTIFIDLFTTNHINYNLRSQSDFVIPQVQTVCKGSKSFGYFGRIT